MCGSLLHRGPDEEGFYIAPKIGLGIRRLAIIDLKTGSQPISNESRDVWVILNGEIYNYEELRLKLQQQGHILSTKSDTETIVHLYEDYGLDFVDHLRGMYAIALWDVKRERLILVRDRIGEKPLYYAIENNRLFFGSEIKAILRVGGNRSIDPQALCDYLAVGYVPGSRTFFRGISKLLPGHMLVWEEGNITLHQYLRRNSGRTQKPSFIMAAQELKERLSETVRLCLKSDVEVGAFLSGGIDSSVIVALMRKHAVQVQTFSVGYRGRAKGFNELNFARLISNCLNTKHHELILEPHSSMDLLPRILWHYDEPHGEPTSILVYLLCQFTRRHVKVALSGTGGDEIFFGYPRHMGIRLLQYYQMLPRLIRKQLVERIVAKWPESTKGSRFAKRVKRFVLSSDLPPEHAYLNWVSLLEKDLRMSLLADPIRSQAENPAGDEFLRQYLMASDPTALLEKAAALDVEGYLPEYQLTYMDRMSMAHGLEVRAPLCDFELVDFVTSLPETYRLNGTRSKHIFKEVAQHWIPKRIANRRKVGFDSPIGQWFKDELRGFLINFLSREQVKESGLLNAEIVENMMGDHFLGRRDYSLQLWSILVLEAWYRMYIEDGINDESNLKIEEIRGVTGKEIKAHD